MGAACQAEKLKICCNNKPTLDDCIVVAELTLEAQNYTIYIFTHLKLCLATATHKFKWVKITPISLI